MDVSAFKEKWYTQNVTGRSHLELHQEGESTFSYFWQKVVTCDALTRGHICNSYLFRYWNIVHITAQPVSCLYLKNEASDAVVVHKLWLENKWRSWFKVLLVSFQYYHLPEMSRWCAKISPNQFQANRDAGLWCLLFVCVWWLAGNGVATAIRIRAHILPYKALRFTVGMESGTSSRRSVTLARVRFPILHSFRFPIWISSA